MSIGAFGDPHFEDSMNPEAAPAAKTHHFLGGGVRKIRQASLNADFINKLNMALHKPVREAKMENSFMPDGFLFSDK